MIYDALLQPLLERPSKIDSWAYRSDFKKLDMMPYTNLLATCKAIRGEVKPLFEQKYLSALLLYFEDVPSLQSLSRKLSKLGAAYQNLQVLLRTPVVRTSAAATDNIEICHNGHDYLVRDEAFCLEPRTAARILNCDTLEFVFCQPGIRPLLRSLLKSYFHLGSTDETAMLGADEVGCLVAKGVVITQEQTQEGLPVDVLKPPVSQHGGTMQVYVRQLSGRNQWTAYLDTRGRIKDIDWANFGAEDQKRTEQHLRQWRRMFDTTTRT
ncbi:hypothetical protein LTR37_002174 [Vermiconidia calcicola]|uniref:Uncharacterized protein n=1 Tax=Vermiconidia calcicola TaxID=1690605 RepID=A0ACC3NU60_9PEZI|nr:hypothetical protein LTR37_002174 [Vermiconidia calcicola]